MSRVAFALLLSWSLGCQGRTAAEWKRRSIYQPVTDRFALGAGDEERCDVGDCIWGNYCGGTWRGLADKLDYIQGMGFDAIWISPIVTNSACGYHGYWAQNYSEMEPRFGGEAALKDLIKRAHDKDIWVMIDVAFNHMAWTNTTYEMFHPFDKNEYFHGLPAADKHCFAYKPHTNQSQRETCWPGVGPNRTNNETDDIGSVSDLAHEHPFVTNFFLDWAKRTVDEYDIDGIRLDAVPYINKTFYKKLKTEVYTNHYMVGEVVISDLTTEYLASYQHTTFVNVSEEDTVENRRRLDLMADGVDGPILDGILNYPLFGQLRNTFHGDGFSGGGDSGGQGGNSGGQGGNSGGNSGGSGGSGAGGSGYSLSLSGLAASWQELNSTFKDIGALGNFIENHDQDRWLLGSPEFSTFQTGLVATFFLPGVPIFYYGSEQGMRGNSSDSERREPLWSKGGYSTDAPLYRWMGRLLIARKRLLASVSDEDIDVLQELQGTDGAFLSFQRGPAVVVLSQKGPPTVEELTAQVPVAHPPGTILCDALQDLEQGEPRCYTVGEAWPLTSAGSVHLTLELGRPYVLMPPSDVVLPHALVFSTALLALPLIVALALYCAHDRVLQVRVPVCPEDIDGAKSAPAGDLPQKVVVASLEHVVPVSGDKGGLRVVAGGLGKMAGILCEHHPGDLVSIHACVAGVSYSWAKHWGTISVRVEEDELSCSVLSFAPEQSANKPKVLFLFVDHDIFRKRPGGFHSAGKAETVIYANPFTSREALRFYSAWNQAVAVLVDKLRPDLFHCPDYHSSMSVAYFRRAVPTVLMLHNAEYQGSVETQQFGPKDIKFVSNIFNLTAEVVKEQVMADGCFNMLRPMICYLEKNQSGHGICTVSKNYALEIQQRYPFFWRLPAIHGIDNPFPDNERVVLPGAGEQDFLQARQQAKLRIQREYGLIEDTPLRQSRIFVFLGRWVKQKGVDYIANITTEMLSEHSNAQLIMIGPVGDSFGSYAVKKLQSIVDSGAFKGRLYVHSGFLKVPPELKLACDFCLMPSRDEPFGFVDLEFGAAGAATVGSLKGGLGKTPGFFYRTVNAESGKHVEACFSQAVRRAMVCPSDELKRMSVACWRQSLGPSFRVEGWKNELSQAYVTATNSFRGRLPNVDSFPLSRNSSAHTRMSSEGLLGQESWSSSSLIQAVPELPNRPLPKAPNNDISTSSLLASAVCELNERQDGEHLVQEADEDMLQRLMEANVAVAALTKAKEQSAQTMLAEIKWSLKLASEPSRITQLLGQNIGGVLGVDLLICGSYMLGPVLCVCLFELGQSLRAQDAPLTLLSDAPWAALLQILGVLAWTGAATRVRPNHLMSVAILSRTLLLPLGAMLLPAPIITALYGIITAGDYTLLFFAFMAAATGDIGKLAVQTACMMTLRTTCFRCVTPLVQAMNSSLAWRLPVLTIVVVFLLVPAMALRWAPQSYTEFRLPDMKGQLLSLSRRKVPLLMGFAQVTEAFASVYAAAWMHRCLIQWDWNAFISEPILSLDFFTVLALLSPLLILVAASCQPGGTIFLIKGFAFFSISCVALQAFIVVSMAGSGLWQGFEVVFVVVAALSQISQHAVVLATIGSRWRFIAYICVVAVVSLAAQALALVLVSASPSLGWLIGATVVGILCRLCAAAFFSSEATGILRTRRERKLILEVDAAASRAHRIQDGCQV